MVVSIPMPVVLAVVPADGPMAKETHYIS